MNNNEVGDKPKFIGDVGIIGCGRASLAVYCIQNIADIQVGIQDNSDKI